MVGQFSEPPVRPRPTGAAIARPPLSRLYATQAMVLLALVAGAAWIDITTAGSILLGGLISIGPNWYFARQAFRFRGALASPLVVRAFYSGEMGKFVLTAAIFAVVFATVRPLNAAALWLAFVGMTLGHSVMWHQLLNRSAGDSVGGKARL